MVIQPFVSRLLDLRLGACGRLKPSVALGVFVPCSSPLELSSTRFLEAVALGVFAPCSSSSLSSELSCAWLSESLSLRSFVCNIIEDAPPMLPDGMLARLVRFSFNETSKDVEFDP